MQKRFTQREFAFFIFGLILPVAALATAPTISCPSAIAKVNVACDPTRYSDTSQIMDADPSGDISEQNARDIQVQQLQAVQDANDAFTASCKPAATACVKACKNGTAAQKKMCAAAQNQVQGTENQAQADQKAENGNGANGTLPAPAAAPPAQSPPTQNASQDSGQPSNNTTSAQDTSTAPSRSPPPNAASAPSTQAGSGAGFTEGSNQTSASTASTVPPANSAGSGTGLGANGSQLTGSNPGRMPMTVDGSMDQTGKDPAASKQAGSAEYASVLASIDKTDKGKNDGGTSGVPVSGADEKLPPGGNKPANKTSPNRELASYIGRSILRHPDIAAPHDDLFHHITTRIQSYCKLKELVGCN